MIVKKEIETMATKNNSHWLKSFILLQKFQGDFWFFVMGRKYFTKLYSLVKHKVFTHLSIVATAGIKNHPYVFGNVWLIHYLPYA